MNYFLFILFISFLLSSLLQVSAEYVCSCGCCTPDPNGGAGCATISPFYQHLTAPNCTGDYFPDLSICRKLCRSAYIGDCDPTHVVGTCSDPNQNEIQFNQMNNIREKLKKLSLLDGSKNISISNEIKNSMEKFSSPSGSIYPDFSCVCICDDIGPNANQFVGFAPIPDDPISCGQSCDRTWSGRDRIPCTDPTVHAGGTSSDYHFYGWDAAGSFIEINFPVNHIPVLDTVGPAYLAVISPVQQRVLFSYIPNQPQFPSYNGECTEAGQVSFGRFLYNCTEMFVTNQMGGAKYEISYSMPDRNGPITGYLELSVADF